MACNPAIRMTRFTTIARTGRFNKKICELHLAILGLGAGLFPGWNLVVDLNGGTIPKFEHTRSHDFVTRLYT